MTRKIPAFAPLQRLLHWLMSICLISMLFIGVGMVWTIAPRFAPLVATHKTLGIIILLLVFLRLCLRLGYGAPPLPAQLPEPMKRAAHLMHALLYALMIAMPLIGWGMMSAGAYPLVLYGNIQLPSILPQNDALHTLLWNAHCYLAFIFFGVILAHMAAALFHALVLRDGVFESMAPLPYAPRATAQKISRSE